MRYGIGLFEFVFIMALFMTPIFILFFYATTSDQLVINITNTYLDEYKQCQIDLKNTQPICPSCVCSSSNGISLYISGVITGFVIAYIIVTYKDKIYELLSKNKKDKKK